MFPADRRYRKKAGLKMKAFLRGHNQKKFILLSVLAVLFAVILGIGIYAANYWNLLPKKSYTAEKFGIKTVKSSVDFNSNGVDDYTDILLGARQDAKNHPAYNGQYYAGGYPPDNIGVCTDVIWRGFKKAGYSLRDMVDSDIQARPQDYEDVTQRDKNIDFRRVLNLKVFFEKYAVSLTQDATKIAEWQPSDIIIFDDSHIAIASDKRNRNGQVYIIHNAGQPNREEDALTHMKITGHYRFDAAAIEKSMLLAWKE